MALYEHDNPIYKLIKFIDLCARKGYACAQICNHILGDFMGKRKYNEYECSGGIVSMKVPRILQGSIDIFTVRLNETDLSLVKARYWRMGANSFSVYTGFRKSGKKRTVYLQQFLTGARFVRFLDGDRFNFCRNNLQPVARRVNQKLKYHKYTKNNNGIVVVYDGNNKKFIIDDFNIDLVLERTWRVNPNGYVETTDSLNRTTLMLHRLIINAPYGEYVDHINHDPTDNRIANLRLCTQSENLHNPSGIRPTNRTGYRGVGFVTRKGLRKRWRARIKIHGKDISKYFHTRDEAAKQRQKWELQYNPSGMINESL